MLRSALLLAAAVAVWPAHAREKVKVVLLPSAKYCDPSMLLELEKGERPPLEDQSLLQKAKGTAPLTLPRNFKCTPDGRFVTERHPSVLASFDGDFMALANVASSRFSALAVNSTPVGAPTAVPTFVPTAPPTPTATPTPIPTAIPTPKPTATPTPKPTPTPTTTPKPKPMPTQASQPAPTAHPVISVREEKAPASKRQSASETKTQTVRAPASDVPVGNLTFSLPSVPVLPAAPTSPLVLAPPVPAGPEVAIVLSGGRFYPDRILLQEGRETHLIFTTVNSKPAALIVEKLNLQRWIGSDNSATPKHDRWEADREVAKNRMTEIRLDPVSGTYVFHDAITGARGEIIVEK